MEGRKSLVLSYISDNIKNLRILSLEHVMGWRSHFVSNNSLPEESNGTDRTKGAEAGRGRWRSWQIGREAGGRETA